MTIWRSAVLARLSPKYGSPVLTARALEHLCHTFCCNPDAVYQPPLADFTIAVSVVEAALALEGVKSWLLPGALAYCAQFPLHVIQKTASLLQCVDPPTQRLYSLPPDYHNICMRMQGSLENARDYRRATNFSAPSNPDCTAPALCRTTLDTASDLTAKDPTLLGATTRAAPKLERYLHDLCDACTLSYELADRVALYCIWDGLLELFDDGRTWTTIRAEARCYIQGLLVDGSEGLGGKRKAGLADRGEACKRAKVDDSDTDTDEDADSSFSHLLDRVMHYMRPSG